MKEKFPYLLYSLEVEKIDPMEDEINAKISGVMQHITQTMAARYRHAYRPVHAKSHGILIGTLEVDGSLPPHLAQGLFAQGGSYDLVMRFSTNPGDLLADKVSTPRGLAIKVIGVKGARVANHANYSTQDFVCVNSDAFAAPDPAGFLKQIELFDKTLETSEGVKHAVSVTARATNAALAVVGAHSATLEGVGAPANHILGETFFTAVPLRFGDLVGKLSFIPHTVNLKRLTGKGADLSKDYNALELEIKEFFETESAVWDVQVQLALAGDNSGKLVDEENFPIEKADQKWPVKQSPWQTIAQIKVSPQNSYSDARQLFVDEQLSFSPWHALKAHQPLGGIMRSRLRAYEEAQKYRILRNARTLVEPSSKAEIPN